MRWIFFAALVGCGPMGEPKQAWEKKPSSEPGEAKSAEPYTPPPPETAKDPSHEDVCRKMWKLIADDADAKAKKNPKQKIPGDNERSGFLQDCYKSGKEESKANPEKYNCQKKCIVEAEVIADVEKCGKACK